jgi:crossover junction endodeoxyribonuclease RuvC
MTTRILGIDPGYQVTGYGVVDFDGNHLRHVRHGVIRVTGADVGEKLRAIFRELGAVLEELSPVEIAVERVFVHKNADSAIKLGQARGAAITACADRGLPVFEYTPNQVKQATVGRGHAGKQQVQHMVKVLLCLPELPQSDAADALAISICHGHFRQGAAKLARAADLRRSRAQ